MKIAILGGTGRLGAGLALRWAACGDEVILGSRDERRAGETATRLNRLLGKDAVQGMMNCYAAAEAEVVVLTVPYSAHLPTLMGVKDALGGKLLIDTTVPLDPQMPERLLPMEFGSALQEAQLLLGSDTKVVAAFQNIPFRLLKDAGTAIDCDVLVCGDDPHARDLTAQLVVKAGLRAVDVGSSRHARTVEGLTPLLIGLKRRYKGREMGIRITGLPPLDVPASHHTQADLSEHTQ